MRETRVSNGGRFAPLAAGAGMIALIAVWAPALPGFAPPPFVRHMLADVALKAVAAPLIAAGFAAMLRPVQLPRPLPASAVAFAMLWLWHVPLLHGLAALSPVVRGIEEVCLLGAGLVLWASALRATRPTRAPAAAKAFATALPIPAEAPVTMTVWPCSFIVALRGERNIRCKDRACATSAALTRAARRARLRCPARGRR